MNSKVTFRAVDLDDLGLDGDLQPERRGGEVIDRDVRADRILAGVEVLSRKSRQAYSTSLTMRGVA